MTANTPATVIPFGPQLIGRIEKSFNAFLQGVLDGTGLNETQWVALNLAAAGGGPETRDQLVARVSGVLKTGGDVAEAHVAALERAGLTETGPGGAVGLSGTGRTTVARIRSATDGFTQQLWGDLPAEDIETASRLLRTVLARAEALAAAS